MRVNDDELAIIRRHIENGMPLQFISNCIQAVGGIDINSPAIFLGYRDIFRYMISSKLVILKRSAIVDMIKLLNDDDIETIRSMIDYGIDVSFGNYYGLRMSRIRGFTLISGYLEGLLSEVALSSLRSLYPPTK
jgi:hypothetical protein